jgi:fibronectin-binding autotransporter adhesin
VKAPLSLSTTLAGIFAFGAASVISAFAADATWNVNADGNWSDNANWNPSAAPGATVGTTNADTATFGTAITAARAITVDANRNIFGIDFAGNSSAYNLSGGNLLLSNGGFIRTSLGGSGHTDTIATPIAIQGDAGSAFFTGGSTTNTRLLVLSGDVTGVSTGTNVTTLTLNGANTGNNAVSGVIGDGIGGGKLAIVKSGAGAWNLDSTTGNTYTGGTTLSAGTLRIRHGAGLGTGQLLVTGTSTLGQIATSTTITVANAVDINGVNLTIAIPSATNGINFTGQFTGSGTITSTGGTNTIYSLSNTGNTFSGDLVLAGGNTAQVASIGDAGVVDLGSGAGLGRFRYTGSSALTFNTRQFRMAGTTGNAFIENTGTAALTINTNLAITGTGNKTLTLGGTGTGFNNVFGGNIGDGTGSTISLTKADGGVWALGGTNTYSGITNLNAQGTTGRLIFQGAQSLSPNTTIAFNQNSSNVQAISFLDDGVGTINFARPITFVGANTTQVMNIFVGNNNTVNGGSSSGTTTGSTIQVGDITWDNATQAANNTRTFNLTGANSYSMLTGNFILPNLSTRTAGGTWTNALNPTTASLTIGGNITMASGNNVDGGIPVLQLGGTAAGNAVTGSISDAADVATTNRPLSVTKTGTSDWTLNGNNTYTGTTTVSAGSLFINGNSTAATGAITVASVATLGGIGIVGGNTSLSGTLIPGNSPGTLTFAQNLALNNGSTYIFEAGDLTAVLGMLTLNNNWTLKLGTGFQDGGSVTIFTYGTAGSLHLTPTFNIDDLGFTPTGTLSLIDTGSSITLHPRAGLARSARARQRADSRPRPA